MCLHIAKKIYKEWAEKSSNFSNKEGYAKCLMSAQELQEVYRFRKQDRNTEIYALIGDPADKSLGHLFHNAFFEDAGVNAVYLRICVKKDALASFFTAISALPFKGLSVTMPHKETVLPLLTDISMQTRLIGACNTIQCTSNQMIGHNTDGIGALNAIEKRGNVFGKHLLFIGAGGAAKAMIFEALERGAYVTVVNRTPERALKIAKSIDPNHLKKVNAGGWDLMPKVCTQGYDVIINCIPESDLIEEQWILPKKIAMDVVYTPKNTPFLIKASKKKCLIIFGGEMFVGQALEQQRLWFPNPSSPNVVANSGRISLVLFEL
jgi:3-dehydroquinate dehydratase/shikimate dehydrogenase